MDDSKEFPIGRRALPDRYTRIGVAYSGARLYRCGETSIFDRISGFFSERFGSSEPEVPKARSLEACTALSEDARELMIQRQDGVARSAATKRALEMASKTAWPSNATDDAESAYMQLISQAYAADRSWFFFLRGRIADEFRDDTFAECLSDFR